ncbi:peptidase S15 [Ameyamaea chiangmaiensis NBRC 103196]|nr:peptidase S15 [Ameyamaea chiangmaiensis NBRC 103196]
MGAAAALMPSLSHAQNDAPIAPALNDPEIQITENIWIEMPDGARLAARLFLPRSAQHQPVGTVLEYLPYRKRDGYRYRDDVAGAFFATHGIAFIRVDIRGTGDSDGAIEDEYRPDEQNDAVHVIQWIATQVWCNGNVGMRGISYGSFTGLQAAAKRLPALKAIVSACGTELRYVDDIHYRGGCLLQAQFDWGMEWQVIMRAPPDPAIVGEERWRHMWQQRLDATRPVSIDWTGHQRLDDTWAYGSVEDDTAIRCPIYHVAGMLDCYVDSAPRLMERMPDVPQKALIGPWTHKWPGYPDPPGHSGPPSAAANGVPGPGLDWLPEEARWWRHWLAGEANGVMDGPRLWTFQATATPGEEFPRDTPGRWVGQEHWPSEAVGHTTHYLQKGHLKPQPAERERLSCPQSLLVGFSTPTTYSSGDPLSWWREQSGDDELSLTFDGALLTEPLDLLGQPTFHLRVRADRPVAKVFARLTEVTPDGQSNLISYAILNLTHRDSDRAPAPLQPGRDYDVILKGVFCCRRILPGNRLRVAISESWWPVTWPSPETVTLEITTGASHVTLPVMHDAVDTSMPIRQLDRRYDQSGLPGPPYHDRLAHVRVEGTHGRRVFTLETGSTHPEETPIAGLDTRMGEAARSRRAIREDDPNSAEMEAEYITTYQKPGWDIRLRAWSLTTSTPTHFLCRETFDAWENGKHVFSRSWQRRLPRDLV